MPLIITLIGQVWFHIINHNKEKSFIYHIKNQIKKVSLIGRLSLVFKAPTNSYKQLKCK